MNLYAYAGSNPVAFADPFGLCTEADGWKDCDRMIGGEQGLNVFRAAVRSGEWTYSWGQTQYGEPAVDYGGRVGDCTDYVRNAVQEGLAGGWAGGDKANTADFLDGKATGFTEVEGSRIQTGDVVVQGSHAGVVAGVSPEGAVVAWQNAGTPATGEGLRGYRNGDTGPRGFKAGGWYGPSEPRFYRALKPNENRL